MDIIVKGLPAKFTWDHWERCAEQYASASEPVRQGERTWDFRFTTMEDLENMLTDADYYADPLGFDEDIARTVCPSAARALPKLRAAFEGIQQGRRQPS